MIVSTDQWTNKMSNNPTHMLNVENICLCLVIRCRSLSSDNHQKLNKQSDSMKHTVNTSVGNKKIYSSQPSNHQRSLQEEEELHKMSNL